MSSIEIEIIVHFVAIGRIDDHHCLNFLFIMFYSDPVPHIYHGDTSTYTVELIDMMKNNTLKYYGVEIDRNLKYYKDYETTCARRVK